MFEGAWDVGRVLVHLLQVCFQEGQTRFTNIAQVKSPLIILQLHYVCSVVSCADHVFACLFLYTLGTQLYLHICIGGEVFLFGDIVGKKSYWQCFVLQRVPLSQWGTLFILINKNNVSKLICNSYSALLHTMWHILCVYFDLILLIWYRANEKII